MKKIWISILVLVAVGIVALVIVQANTLRVARSSFDNYYAFRGCTKVLAKTDTAGVCMTGDGQIIGITEYNGKWYAEGEVPNQ